MKKNILNNKSKGFTLVELIATIFIISLVLGLGVFGVTKLISSAKENGTIVTENNLKSSSIDYINENSDIVKWIVSENNEEDNETEQKEFTCVSISALINSGYFKENNIEKSNYTKENYIKIYRNMTTKVITKEELEDSNVEIDKCSNYYIIPPTCNDLTYNGFEQNLIKIDEDSPYEVTNNLKTDAGSHEVKLTLSQEDKTFTNNSKEITQICRINQKSISIKLEQTQNLYKDEFEGNKYTGNIENIKDYLIIDGLELDHIISSFDVEKNDAGNKIYITNIKITTQDNSTDVTSNYKKHPKINGELILKDKVKIPTCNNLTYNEKDQTLITAKEGYTLSNNVARDAGSYQVYATLDDREAKWEDGTNDTKTLTCEIKKTNPSGIILSEVTKTYTGIDIEFTKENVSIRGNNNEVVDPGDNTTYSFTYYTDPSCKNIATSHIDAGTYYGKTLVQNMKNHNDGTSNCAKLEITNELIVTFSASGGSVDPSSKIVQATESYGELPTPIKTGYIFKGWYTSLNGEGNKITEDSIVTQTTSHTLYAYWEEKYVEVTFHSLSYGESGTDNTTTLKYTYIDGQSFCMDSYNSTKGYCEIFTKDGYYISTWYFKELDVNYKLNHNIWTSWINTNYTNDKSPLNAYANWSAKTIKVTFKRNYSSTDTTTATKTYTYGVTGQSFSGAASWTRTGYTRLGWALTQDATSKNYTWTNGIADTWINNNAPAITLYAVWKDQTAPTCSISKSNTYSSSGVDVTVKCSDSGSGCKTGTQTSSDLKASKTYTVYDNVGNKGTCTATIKTTKRYSKKTCSTCKSCSSAGCSTYSSWVKVGSTYESSNLTSTTSTTKTTCSATGRSSPSEAYRCTSYTRSCTAYKTSCSSCGCSSWGNWSSYSYTSCSASSSTQCQSKTVYY